MVARIARQSVPWFIDEAHFMTQARQVGVPTPEVLGLEQHHHGGELLSFSIQQFLPGRPLDDLVAQLPAAELERLVIDAGELLARVHGLAAGGERGIRHELRVPSADLIDRVKGIVSTRLGSTAAHVVERGATLLLDASTTQAASAQSLAQGDFMPKNLLVHEGQIAGVLDWEFAGPASPAFDLARWEVSAGGPLQNRSDLVRRGYSRLTNPAEAEAGLTAAFAIDWALEKLSWKNPAEPAQFQRCVDIIAHYARQ